MCQKCLVERCCCCRCQTDSEQNVLLINQVTLIIPSHMCVCVSICVCIRIASWTCQVGVDWMWQQLLDAGCQGWHSQRPKTRKPEKLFDIWLPRPHPTSVCDGDNDGFWWIPLELVTLIRVYIYLHDWEGGYNCVEKVIKYCSPSKEKKKRK